MSTAGIVAIACAFIAAMVLGFAISFGCVCGHIARKKGYSKGAFWWFGFFAGPIALLIILFAAKSRITNKRPW